MITKLKIEIIADLPTNYRNSLKETPERILNTTLTNYPRGLVRLEEEGFSWDEASGMVPPPGEGSSSYFKDVKFSAELRALQEERGDLPSDLPDLTPTIESNGYAWG